MKSNTKMNNLVGEWYGIRLFPDSQCKKEDLKNFRKNRCPFLSQIMDKEYSCTKNSNSKGVCTITTRTKDDYLDWMVCPYRAIDYALLHSVVKRLFGKGENAKIIPAVVLSDISVIKELKTIQDEFFIFFQDKLGGEISLLGTFETPELSFDITIVEARFSNDELVIGKYGILEVQTMDFHGSYKGAVEALISAVDLHSKDFHEIIATRSDWLARGIEGPNIANVFKRTFYQTILKFKLADKCDCAGVILAIPRAVWFSWKPHLGNADFAYKSSQFVKEKPINGSTWIFVIDLDSQKSKSSDSTLSFNEQIPIDANQLIDAAFKTVPSKIIETTLPNVKKQIIERIKKENKEISIK